MTNTEKEKQNTKTSGEVRQEFINRIKDLKTQISNRYQNLNLEALWLFVATLGCWSVHQIFAQFAALILVFLLFFYKVFEGKKQDTTFDKLLKEIREDVDNSILEGDARLARLRELDEIRNDLRLKSIYHKAPNFLAVITFYLITVFLNTQEVFKAINF